MQSIAHPPDGTQHLIERDFKMTAIRTIAAQIVAAATAFSLSVALIGATVTNPAPNSPAPNSNAAQQELLA